MTDSDVALLHARFSLADHKRNVWFATVEERVNPEDVLAPSFWRHVAGNMRPYDEIVIACDSCEWRKHLLVVDVWHANAKVIELSHHDMKGDEETTNMEAVELRVQWRGPQLKWCVVRKDGVVVKGNLPDKGVAFENLAALAMERVA